jgi:hypothetical protein
MKVLNTCEKNVAGVARSARAAIVLPSLFALAVLGIKQPQMAGPAVLGTLVHLVLVSYDTAGTVRFAQSAMLTLLGAVAIGLGTLASESLWLAVGGTIVMGALSELPLLARGHITAIRRALLLAFMFAVATPAPARTLFPYLAGWLLAGVIAQPVLFFTWIPLQNSSAADEGATSYDHRAHARAPSDRSIWMGNAIRLGLALGLAVLLTRLIKVEHAFWLVLGVLPVLNTNAGSAARMFWQEQTGTLIGFLVSAVVVAIIGPHQGYWLILPFVTFGSAYAASAVVSR